MPKARKRGLLGNRAAFNGRLDATDLAILDALQGSGRMSNVDLARRVGISAPGCLERVRKLEERGVIRGYVALVDPGAVNKSTTAFVSIALRSHGGDILERVTHAVQKLEEVRGCWHIAGDVDLLLKVIVSDLAAYETFVQRKLSVIDGIGRIRTFFALAAPKDETRLPLDAVGIVGTREA